MSQIDLPSAADAAKRAHAAAAAPKYLNPKTVQQIERAIDAGNMSVTLDGYDITDWKYTQDALRARGYTVKTVQTGMNESGLKVSWGMTDAETAEAYYNK